MTIRSMIDARRTAESVVDVELLAVKHRDEDVSVPEPFRLAPDLFGLLGWDT